jgi:carbon monoxide dehydrogenase subunit G
MIEVQRQITVPSPPDAVWAVLSDPSQVVHCIPGAALESEDGDSFAGRMTVAFGGLRVPFRGSGTLALQAPARRGTLTGQGKDNNGGTRFKVAADFAITAAPADGSSLVDLTGRVELAGKLATIIEAGAGVVIDAMLTDFATNLAAASRPASSGEPAPAVASQLSTRVWLRSLAATVGHLWRVIWRRT